jgi:hypothetical protein
MFLSTHHNSVNSIANSTQLIEFSHSFSFCVIRGVTQVVPGTNSSRLSWKSVEGAALTVGEEDEGDDGGAGAGELPAGHGRALQLHPILTRGLHSSTCQLNVSAFGGTRKNSGVLRDRLRRGWRECLGVLGMR